MVTARLVRAPKRHIGKGSLSLDLSLDTPTRLALDRPSSVNGGDGQKCVRIGRPARTLDCDFEVFSIRFGNLAADLRRSIRVSLN